MTWAQAGLSLEERLALIKVTRGEGDDPCLIWGGARTSRGDYGAIRNEDGKLEKAHRVVFRLTYGWAPKVVRHTCDNGLCVEPTHLLGGTQADNVADMVERGRHLAVSNPEAWRKSHENRPSRDPSTYPRGKEHHIHHREVVRDVVGRFA